jgi:hypothetical protein
MPTMRVQPLRGGMTLSATFRSGVQGATNTLPLFFICRFSGAGSYTTNSLQSHTPFLPAGPLVPSTSRRELFVGLSK